MPVVSDSDCSLYYEASGTGPAVVFLNDVGFGAWLWGWQHAALSGRFETLVFDPRGTGRSEGVLTEDISVFVEDTERVLSAHGARRAHLVGAGFGGMVALAYAREYDRARSLTLMGTALDGARVSTDALELMAGPGREALEPCFSEAFLGEKEERIDQIQEWRREDDADPEQRTTQANALCGFSCDAPYEITMPALVIHGIDDPLISVQAGRELAEGLPNGRFVSVAGNHLAFIESSRHVNDELFGFLESVGGG